MKDITSWVTIVQCAVERAKKTIKFSQGFQPASIFSIKSPENDEPWLLTISMDGVVNYTIDNPTYSIGRFFLFSGRHAHRNIATPTLPRACTRKHPPPSQKRHSRRISYNIGPQCSYFCKSVECLTKSKKKLLYKKKQSLPMDRIYIFFLQPVATISLSLIISNRGIGSIITTVSWQDVKAHN